MDRTSLSHNRINYKRTAPDFSESGISSLNTFDVGQTGTRAVRDEAWNQLEEEINQNIQDYDTSLEESEITKGECVLTMNCIFGNKFVKNGSIFFCSEICR